MTLTDTMILPTAQGLVAALAVQVARLRVPPQLVGLRIGAQASAVLGPNVDECCQGLAWVRPVGAGPGGDPPAFQSEMRNCPPYNWVVTYELGIARCMPFGSGEDDLDPITQDVWDLAAADQMADFSAMVGACQCYLGSVTPPLHYAIGQWQPTEISGGCTASTLQVQVLENRQCMIPC